jgi:hypothetical protein
MMVGSAPYQKACNACGKQIILGIDKETSKWRPWDNFALGEKHNCSAKAANQNHETIATTATSGLGAAKSEEVAIVHARVTELKQGQDMLTWLVEKIARKVGVEIENDNQAKQ